MASVVPNVRVAQAPTASISWGNFVGIVAMAMFVVYLIAKGRLGVYIGMLLGSGGTTAATAPGAPGTTSAGGITGFAGNPFLAGQTVPVSNFTSDPLGQSLLTSQAPLLFGQ